MYKNILLQHYNMFSKGEGVRIDVPFKWLLPAEPHMSEVQAMCSGRQRGGEDEDALTGSGEGRSQK